MLFQALTLRSMRSMKKKVFKTLQPKYRKFNVSLSSTISFIFDYILILQTMQILKFVILINFSQTNCLSISSRSNRTEDCA